MVSDASQNHSVKAHTFDDTRQSKGISTEIISKKRDEELSTARSPLRPDNAAVNAAEIHKKAVKRFRVLSKDARNSSVPKASKISFTNSWFPPPPILSRRLGSENELLMGLDIETNDWPDLPTGGNKGNIGQFGFYNLCSSEDLNQRCVQLGWVVGLGDKFSVKKEYLITPSDYIISDKATKFHKISHAEALASGRPLRDVLIEFIEDVRSLLRHKGRVVCHHLEFDCGILATELKRCALMEEYTVLQQAAHAGLCTMDPEVGRYVLQRAEQEGGPESGKNTLSLRKLVSHVCPEFGFLLKDHHSAGIDAELHYQVGRAVQHLATPPTGTVSVAT